MSRALFTSLVLATGLALGACATGPAPDSPDSSAVPSLRTLSAAEQRGHDFAVRRCSGCHTVGLDDGGASEGPAFRRLAMRYNPISLERRFAEVSAHGFDRMPPVTFTRAELDDLVTYVDSLNGY